MRKKLTGFIASIGMLAALLLSGCGGGNSSDVLTNDRLFKSDSISTYYKYDANGIRVLKITGKPFVAIRYLKAEPEKATDSFFGFYDVTQEELIAGTAHELEISAGDVVYYPQFAFPSGTKIVRPFNFGHKDDFNDSEFTITVKENNNTEWRFTLNDQSVKATTTVAGQAFKTGNPGFASDDGIFTAMVAIPIQP
ncbi:MAG: hypothetical protein WC749_15920 [Dehalococcoidia bacterium]